MKFKLMGLAEFKERSRQGTSIAAERLGISKLTKVPSDADLFCMFDPELGIESPGDLVDHFYTRTSRFYSSFQHRDEVIQILRTRFPGHTASMIETADRICSGSFDLLGFKGLRFGGVVPDWHIDPISKKQSPKVHWSRINEVDAAETGDKKIIWELNRHQYFAILGQAYWLTDDEKYAKTFVTHIESWISENPPKIGVNWLSSLELAFRSMSWIWGFHFFRTSPHFKTSTLLNILKCLYLFGRHLESYLSIYFSPNTHLTGEALGLYFLGSFLPELEAAKRWRDLGYHTLIGALDFQVRCDGVYCEQSSHYQRYTTDFYSNLLILRQLEGSKVDPKLTHKISRLLDFLLHITQPNGTTPLIGDDDGGRLFFLDNVDLTDFRPTLALGSALTERTDLKYVAGDAGPELLWILGPEGLREYDAMPTSLPIATSKAFDQGGFYSARCSWANDADFILVDGGAHGFLNGGHAHADALNVLISIGGRPMFIDSGTFNYTSDLAARDQFRSTEAHNCLTVNGNGSSVPAGPFSWKEVAISRLLKWSDDQERVQFSGQHDGFSELGVDYTRQVIFSRQGLVEISDLISSVGKNFFELYFVLSPELNVVTEVGSVLVFEGTKQLARMETTLSIGEEARWLVEDWEVSFRYGALVPTKRLRLGIWASGDISIINVIKRL